MSKWEGRDDWKAIEREERMAEARDTLNEQRGFRICPTCGEDWPLDLDECPGCDEYITDTCNLCDRPIPEAFGAALCHYCEGVAKAHARLDQAEREWFADGRPD